MLTLRDGRYGAGGSWLEFILGSSENEIILLQGEE